MLSAASAAGSPACHRARSAHQLPKRLRAHLDGVSAQGDRPARPRSGYVYDPAVAADRARALRAALPPWAALLYAVKANSFPPVLAALAAGGVDGFEVTSPAEVAAANAAWRAGGPRGLPAPMLAAAGPAKHPQMLAELCAAGVDVVHVESPLELTRLSAVAAMTDRQVRVGLRVNPARVGVTGTLATGGRPAPFGIGEPDVPDVLDLARSLPGVEVIGFHVHAVCGNRDALAHAAYVEQVCRWADRTAAAHRLELRWIDVGGGLGVSYGNADPLDLDLLADALHRLHPPSGAEVVFEPGRWLVADCGWYVAEVVDVKRSYGHAYVIVRGGIGGFALPATEDFPFPVAVLPVQDWPAGIPRPELRDEPVTVVGELCTPEDVIVRDVTVDRVRAGDLLVVPQAGAYGWEFALQAFLGHPPATREVITRQAALPDPRSRQLEATP